MRMHQHEFEASGLDIQESELRVATADSSDPEIDPAVTQVLKLLRERINMDAVFVGEFRAGQPLFRPRELSSHPEQAACDPIEESWGHRVVVQRHPQLKAAAQAAGLGIKTSLTKFPAGEFISTSVLLKFGRCYGTLCCFSAGDSQLLHQRNVKNLRYTAQLMAQKIDQNYRRKAQQADDSRWAIEPLESTFTRLL